jgi:pteridine reductase
MPFEKNERVAVVTGSGRRRVGNVVARSLAEKGYAVALHYHSSAEAARATADELRLDGVECEAFKADVGSERSVDDMFEAISERFGRVDVLVTTASIWSTVSLEETTEEDLLGNFRANTLGTFFCARRAGLLMCEQESGGAIVTIGDWAIERPYVDHAAYFVSKGAIPTLTRTLAVELALRNPRVRVNCIHPGPVMFPPDSSEQDREMMVASTLTKNANCPDSIAQAVQFLIENEFVTGVCLPVDGGRTVFAMESTSRSGPI